MRPRFRTSSVGAEVLSAWLALGLVVACTSSNRSQEVGTAAESPTEPSATDSSATSSPATDTPAAEPSGAEPSGAEPSEPSTTESPEPSAPEDTAGEQPDAEASSDSSIEGETTTPPAPSSAGCSANAECEARGLVCVREVDEQVFGAASCGACLRDSDYSRACDEDADCCTGKCCIGCGEREGLCIADEGALPVEALSDEVVHPSEPRCGGAPPAGTQECLGDSDCSDGRICYFEDSPPRCDLGCVGPMDQCDELAPCTDGQVCVGVPAAELLSSPCTCGGGRYCAPECTGDESCGEQERCDEEGRCQALSCLDGHECGASKVCDVDSPVKDPHGCRVLGCGEEGAAACGTNRQCNPSSSSGNGCERKPCATGADCDCGVCSPVTNSCVSRPGVCAF